MRQVLGGGISEALSSLARAPKGQAADVFNRRDTVEDESSWSFMNEARRCVMRILSACLLAVVWFTLPTSASANTWPHVGERWSDRSTVVQGWLEQDPLIHAVIERWYDRFPTYTDLGTKERKDEAARDREKDADSSGKDTRSYDNVLSPSFDIPNSVNGYSRGSDPWWGTRSEGDPMVRELSREPLER
jgi:hypothetical protein